MSKRELSCVASLTVVTIPVPRSAGRFEARLDGDDRLLCISRTPFFDAARELLVDGYDPNLLLILRHSGADVDCLRASLATAASLSVEETDYGPKLRCWKPMRTLAVTPSIASDQSEATALPSSPIESVGNEH